MDDETYRGIGIWDPATGTLAVDFVEERTKLHGVAHFVLKEGLLHSRWAFFDEPGGKPSRCGRGRTSSPGAGAGPAELFE